MDSTFVKKATLTNEIYKGYDDIRYLLEQIKRMKNGDISKYLDVLADQVDSIHDYTDDLIRLDQFDRSRKRYNKINEYQNEAQFQTSEESNCLYIIGKTCNIVGYTFIAFMLMYLFFALIYISLNPVKY